MFTNLNIPAERESSMGKLEEISQKIAPKYRRKIIWEIQDLNNQRSFKRQQRKEKGEVFV